ncbi:MAG TPA: bifunctional (p)ppGpp synthetase/guanosine-3',5'-bis(diphosphate) 3'-pyrophosphohydrolase [Dehalococcoidia bacterium]|nr:bifunctional (p)ppGpp synthetase/guanosine-3',5'-bis(diphosphate) 3'-pyrophosphohydrolase [Dehalococcoidia bacterium]
MVATVEGLIEKTQAYLAGDRTHLIEEAYRFAEECHRDQLRKTGDPYITHPLDTAATVADLQLDASAVAAALIHDVQEDCGISNAELTKRFGREVAHLVDGATKLDKIAWKAPEEDVRDRAAQAENLRKMFLAMARDVRVVIIKLADRLHNMRTLYALSLEKQQLVAQETMEIYAPLASRLGIWQISRELEDLSFRYLNPERYHQIANLLASSRTAREKYIAQVETIVRKELDKNGVHAEVQGRAKHLFSIHQKMDKYAAQGKTFNEIHDLLALRILVETEADCYRALGVVHSLWRPIPGQFDDYIANPKEGVYRSLHTTVLCLGARALEVQIRTHEMHRLAEYGVAAHWRYKEGGKRDHRFEERVSWLRQLLEWQRDMAAADDFVELVKTDLFQDQVFVYTPKGEVKDLPVRSTPIDFAYRIHTDIGHRCIGARVNGRLVPLNYQLQNGDIVEILTSKAPRGPSRDWLNSDLGYVMTSHAREKIRAWFKQQERAANVERGRDLLHKELRRLGLSLADCQDLLLRSFKFEETDDFLAALGYGGISLHQIATRLAPLVHPQEEIEEQTVEAPQRPVYTANIEVLGTGDLLTQLARCCNPVPGDDIVGYVTRSRGVTVHRRDCGNVLREDEKERLVEVEWGHRGQLYPVAVRIEAWDRVGLIRDIGSIVAEEKVNMAAVRTQEHSDHTVSVFLTLLTTGVDQLTRLFGKLEAARGVFSVDRHIEGAERQAKA